MAPSFRKWKNRGKFTSRASEKILTYALLKVHICGPIRLYGPIYLYWALLFLCGPQLGGGGLGWSVPALSGKVGKDVLVCVVLQCVIWSDKLGTTSSNLRTTARDKLSRNIAVVLVMSLNISVRKDECFYIGNAVGFVDVAWAVWKIKWIRCGPECGHPVFDHNCCDWFISCWQLLDFQPICTYWLLFWLTLYLMP